MSSSKSDCLYIPVEGTAGVNGPEANSPEQRDAPETSNPEDAIVAHGPGADSPKQVGVPEANNRKRQDDQEKGSAERLDNKKTGGPSDRNATTSARLTTPDSHAPSSAPGPANNPAPRSDAVWQASSSVSDIPRIARRLRLNFNRWSRLSTTGPLPPRSWSHSGTNSPPHLVVPCWPPSEGSSEKRLEALAEKQPEAPRGDLADPPAERLQGAPSEEQRPGVADIAAELDNAPAALRNEQRDVPSETLRTEMLVQLELLTHRPTIRTNTQNATSDDVRVRQEMQPETAALARRRSRRQQGQPPEGEEEEDGENIPFRRPRRRANSESFASARAESVLGRGARRRAKSEAKLVRIREGNGPEGNGGDAGA